MSQIYELVNKNKGDKIDFVADVASFNVEMENSESFFHIPMLEIYSDERVRHEFDCLYQNLVMLGLKDIRSILFCSLISGNTFMVSMCLASVITRRNPLKVLVIDSNIDSPSLHRYESGTHRGGFCDFLRKYDRIEKYVMPSTDPRLFGMKLGSLREDTAEIFNHLRIEAAIRAIESHYDKVILDGPPVVSDTCLDLAKSVDGVVLVLKQGVPVDIAKKARERLAQIQTRVLGAILY